jgi:cobalt-zinc-cadmium efflux system membrane fusion protein
MRSWIWTAAAAVVTRIPTFLTLLLLAGLGVWGYWNDWKVPRFAGLWGKEAGENKEPDEAVIKVSLDPASSPSAPMMRLEFRSAEDVAKVGLKSEPVRVADLARYVTANSMLDYEPTVYAQLTSRAAGTVWHVEKEIGDKLRKGDVLAVVEAAEVGQAKANFLQSLTQLKARTLIRQRLEAAGRVGSVAEKTLLDAETAVREARIKLLGDQQALLNLGLPIRLPDMEPLSDEEAVRHLRLLGLPEEITKKFKEIHTANLLPLVAPFNGQVVQRNVAVGELVQPTQTKSLFVVADVTRLHIELFVKPEDMTDVRVGLTVGFRPDGAADDVVTGKVSHISPEVEEKTRRVRVHAEIENPEGRLRPNTFGTGRILIRAQPRALVIPSEALQAKGAGTQTAPAVAATVTATAGTQTAPAVAVAAATAATATRSHFVFVRVSETSFQARPVQPGTREGNWVEVNGVGEGEEVVTTGSFLLKSELEKARIVGGDD